MNKIFFFEIKKKCKFQHFSLYEFVLTTRKNQIFHENCSIWK